MNFIGLYSSDNSGATELGGLNTRKILVSAIHRLILTQMFTRFRENVSAITSVRYKTVHYLEVFLWEFDHYSARS